MTMPPRMSMPPCLLGLTTAILAALAAQSGMAGRDLTPEERPRVEAALRGLGFERWDEIEFEDGVWEIDDARTPDGKTYELKLRAETFDVVERKED